MKMPFGELKDQDVHKILLDDLLWFGDNIANRNGDLLKAVITGLDGKSLSLILISHCQRTVLP